MLELQTALGAETLLLQNDAVLLYFGDESCAVCRALLPKVETMLGQYPKITAAYVSIKNLPEFTAQRQILSIPAIVLYLQGKETMRFAGIISMGELERRIARYYQLLFRV